MPLLIIIIAARSPLVSLINRKKKGNPLFHFIDPHPLPSSPCYLSRFGPYYEDLTALIPPPLSTSPGFRHFSARRTSVPQKSGRGKKDKRTLFSRMRARVSARIAPATFKELKHKQANRCLLEKNLGKREKKTLISFACTSLSP